MKALDRLRANWERVEQGEPGSRFCAFYEYRRQSRGSGWPLSRILTVGGGVILLLGGLAIGWIPGPGGFISVFGAALLATEWPPLARLLDRVEVLLRDLWRRVRSTWNGSSAWTRAAGLLVVAMVAGAGVWFAFALLFS